MGVIATAFASFAARGTALTNEAVLKSLATKASSKLSTQILPMQYGFPFYGFFAGVPLVGPRRPPSDSGQPAARWSNVTREKAAASCWHSARGVFLDFEEGCSPQMGTFWSGLTKEWAHGPRGK